MAYRNPVTASCFKVKHGLCVTGDTSISGDLTLYGDFAWLNDDALLTITNISSVNLSAGRIFSNNDEIIQVPFSPDLTIIHPLSVVDETIFESAVQMESDLWVKGNLRVDGNAYLSAGIDGVINVGDTNTDNVVFNADIQSSLIPHTTDTYNLGSVDQHWDTLYVHDISAHGSVDIEANTTIGGNTTLSGTFSAAGNSKIDSDLHIVGDLRVDGDVWFNANNTNGTNTINLGDDNTDNVVFNADVDSDIIPDKSMTYDLGSVNQHWSTLYVHDVSAHVV
jgi:cytoskeletal protein CcmA (bactofilin family)